jgi:hypothetical protein
MPTVSLRLSEGDARWLREHAERQGLSLSVFMRRALFDAPADSSDERLEDHERRIAALERLAGGAAY